MSHHKTRSFLRLALAVSFLLGRTTVGSAPNQGTNSTTIDSSEPFNRSHVDLEFSTRIVGGTEVKNEDLSDRYPWFASYYLNGGSRWLQCGGVLIAPEYVLTAAHCIQSGDIEQDATFRIGELCRDNTNNCGQYQEDRDVVAITMPSEFRRADLGSDFALMRLSRASTIEPVQIDTSGLSQNYPSGKTLYAVGFGHTSFGGENSLRLRHVSLGYVDHTACSLKFVTTITSDMMCAAGPGKDSCHNDSGGPLYDKETNTVVGLVSWGTGCASPTHPGVYSRIATEWDWIRDHVCSNHGLPLPLFCNQRQSLNSFTGGSGVGEGKGANEGAPLITVIRGSIGVRRRGVFSIMLTLVSVFSMTIALC